MDSVAKLLRSVALAPDGGRCLIPAGVLVELAQLFDPTIFWSRFSKAPDRRAMRLKAAALTDVEHDRLKRDETIWGEVLALLHQGEAVTETIRTIPIDTGYPSGRSRRFGPTRANSRGRG